MNDWYVWTRRDTGAAGWAHDDANSSPIDSDLDELLRPLLASRFTQLEPLDVGGTQSTHGIPIVTAAWVAKAGRWVFVLRGVGGPFGAAGTTQACAAPIGQPLHEAWSQFWPAVSADERIEPALLKSGTPERHHGDVSSELVGATLRLIASEATVAEAPAEPTGAIELFATISRMIPESAARSLLWSTCHVAASVFNEERILTGRWPELLTEAWPRDRRRLTVGDRFRTADSLPPPGFEEHATVEWLLAEAARQRFPLAESQAATIAEAMVEASRRRPLAIADAEDLAAQQRPDARLSRLADYPEVIRAIAGASPDLACRLLDLTEPGSRVYGMLALGILINPSTPGAHMRDALTAEAVSNGGPLTDSILGHLRNGDSRRVADAALTRHLGDEESLLQARPWLEGLGLTAAEAPELFVFDPRQVARLAYDEPHRAAELIARQSDPLGRLRSVLAVMEPTHSSTMMLLARATATQPDPATIEALLSRTRITELQAIETINNLSSALDRVTQDPTHRDVVTLGLSNWLAGQGIALTRDVAVALLGLGTGFDTGEFGFRSVPATRGRTPQLPTGTWPQSAGQPTPPVVESASRRPSEQPRPKSRRVLTIFRKTVIAILLLAAGALVGFVMAHMGGGL